jgi:DNA-binding transcriptional MocR family regulator
MKIGMLACSDDLREEFYHRHDDLLLNVSPFHLALLTEFITDTIAHGADATIGYYIRQNLDLLRRAFDGSVLRLASDAAPTATVAWIRIAADVSGERLWASLRERGIHILPGTNFYWHPPTPGTRPGSDRQHVAGDRFGRERARDSRADVRRVATGCHSPGL